MRAVVLAVLTAGCAAQPAPATPQPLTPFARLEASRDLDGALVGKSDARATVVMVMASWCTACRVELAMFDRVRGSHAHVRWLAVNYREHEDYRRRGGADAIRALAGEMHWLRIVPAGDELFMSLGSPSKIPTVIVFDSTGNVAARYDRHERKPPDEAELDALLRRLR
jgi:thiol-disulfide isomerase/thioredoxin